jgi:hypothetical protein
VDDPKYPRIYHLPTSPGLLGDDRRISTLSPFLGKRIIITEKMDGENTTLTPQRSYARSPDSKYHPSRDWLRAFHARVASEIPAGWRISGEYLYARHSIPYTRELGNALRSFFYGFGVWNDENELLDWDATIEALTLLEIEVVPVLYDGPFDERVVAKLESGLNTSIQEGFVIRIADKVPYPSRSADEGRFFDSIVKWVRPAHVTSERHWMAGPVIPNELREDVSTRP